jgi:hypothetical protein
MSRQKHSPTDEARRQVEAMAGYGVPQEDIALVIGVDAKTLRLHYRAELDTGAIKANAQVAQTLFKQATTGNTAAAIFWLKARAGWREKHEVEHSGEIATTQISDAERVAAVVELFERAREKTT